ncbi:MAG: PBP1A family penicillin-binding protein [Candidatus Levybacteria bacterium]|nr:PBP1A family penicillin-binding protein [Candidatus Levybacteria bacterium]
MELLSKIIGFLLVFFTKIGDGVILLANLFFDIIKRTLETLSGFIASVVKIIILKLINIKIEMPTSNTHVKELKKTKKSKPIIIFPLTSFGTKLKYFIAGNVFSFLFIFLPLLFFIFLQNLPQPGELSTRQIPQTTKIYDRNGTLLYQFYVSQNRTLVPLSEIPQNIINATIAIEDKDFYRHPGFDILAIGRSLIENVSGRDLQGGSTITQQLIKSALLTPQTSIERKVKEIILAFWTERIYTKDKILEMYFNQVPYGGTAWGVEAASEVYFGKKVKDLDLAQSAFLAGIPRAPSIYSPYGAYPNLWKKRQKEVIGRMIDLGYITKDQGQKALAEELSFKNPRIPIHAPHFVMYVKDFLTNKYGITTVERGGLNVVTSLDLKIQDNAQKVVTEEIQNDIYLNLTNGAVLVTNPANGDILAMIGSKDYNDPNGGNFNVTTGFRQPGSSIKVVTYSAALSNGFTAATILDDSPVSYSSPGSPTYSPVNYDGKFHGRVPLRIALANSFNIPAVKTLNQIGIPTMVNYGQKMGIKTWGDPKNYGLSLTLGGGEVTMVDMATVYGVLANQGVRVELNPVLKISDSNGNVLEEKNQKSPIEQLLNQGTRVLDSGVTFILAGILSDNPARAMEFGTNSPLNIPGHTVSVKTGTSDNKRDNWTIGYTKNYVVTVWVGNNDNSPMSQSLASGITGAAPIWNRIMTSLLGNSKDEVYPVPFNIVQKPCLGRIEYFIKGTENSVNCAYVPSPSVSPTKNP